MDLINNQLTAVANWVHTPDCFDGKPAVHKGRKETHVTPCGKCCTSTVSLLGSSGSARILMGYTHIGSYISLLHDVKLKMDGFLVSIQGPMLMYNLTNLSAIHTQTNYYDLRVYRRIQTHIVSWKKAETHLLLVWVKFAKLRNKNSSGPYEQPSHRLPLLTNVKSKKKMPSLSITHWHVWTTSHLKQPQLVLTGELRVLRDNS